MKQFITLVLVVFAFNVLADEHIFRGQVYYNHPDGTIKIRRTNFVHKKVDGKHSITMVILKKDGTKIKVPASDMKTGKDKTGKEIVALLFKDIKGAPEGVVTVFIGGLLKGSNGMLYWGDFYSAKKGTRLPALEELNSEKEKIKFTFQGAFLHGYVAPKPAP